MGSMIKSVIATGNRGVIIDVECTLSNNLPYIVIVGFTNRAVDEARERIRGAFVTSRILLPRKRITINLAPADLPKSDSSFDMAIAVAILLASDQITAASLHSRRAFIGEFGLDGTTRAVRGIIGKILAGRNNGLDTFYIPQANLAQAQLVPGVRLLPVASLQQLFEHLCGADVIPIIETGDGIAVGLEKVDNDHNSVQLSEIVGQQQAKRALEIAAAGGHNVFFSGPPGTGKSMLAKALASIMPTLTREEMLEVTHLHSLSSHSYDKIVSQRPFRSPHHSASHVAITGGGAQLRPGEISLAHRGVLFFDELPEFGRLTLEALRQPLEDRVISVARAKDTVEYPANFLLLATANPCPCGYFGSASLCQCLPKQILNYQQRVSGPILDRIDLFSEVHEVEHDQLLQQQVEPDTDRRVRDRIEAARHRQAQRFGVTGKANADMTNADIKQLAHLEKSAVSLLNRAAGRLKISARGYMRVIRVARTIADLDGADQIGDHHISEALAYRHHPAKLDIN